MKQCKWCGKPTKNNFCTDSTCQSESAEFRLERQKKEREKWLREIQI